MQFSDTLKVFLLTQVEMSRPSSIIASSLPKCLLTVANREVLDIQLEALEMAEIQNATLVCPSSVVEVIRSWKTDICRRKINLTFAPFEKSLDTAEILFNFAKEITDDFIVIVGSVLFEAEVILRALAEHRTKEPIVTLIMQEVSDLNTPPINLKKSMTEVNAPANFVGYDDNRLVYIKSRTSIVSSINSTKVSLKKNVIKRFPAMKISTSLFDSQIYIFGKNTLQLVGEKKRAVTSIRHHLIPLLVKLQFSNKNEEELAMLNKQHLAFNMSSSNKKLNMEMRCSLCLIAPKVFLARIDSLEDYVHANRIVSSENYSSVVPYGIKTALKKGVEVYLGEKGVVLNENVMIAPICIIGDGTVVNGPCSIKKTVLGRHNRIEPNVKIQACITLDHVTICSKAVIKNSVIGSNVIIEKECVIENAIIAANIKTTEGQKIMDETYNKL